MKRILVLFLFIITLFADEVYFLPQDGVKAEKRITKLFYNAHENIKIAIYSTNQQTG